jgi:apolipoprotein N-acyltransferase
VDALAVRPSLTDGELDGKSSGPAMPSIPSRPSPGFLLQIAAILAAGVLLRLVVGLHPIWWLAWLAPVPVLILAFRFGGPKSGWMVFVAALVGASVNFHYRRSVFPLPIAALGTGIQALVWTLVVLQTRRVVIRYKAAWTVLAYPVFWVAVDTLAAAFKDSGNEGSLAYTQIPCLPILQVASLFGVGGLLFLLTLVPSTLALAIAYGCTVRRAWLAYAGTFLILAAAIAFGLARLRHPAHGRETGLGLVAIDDAIGPKATPGYMKSIWDEYDRHISSLSAQGAEVIALPEKIGLVTPTTAAKWRQHLGDMAARNHVWIEAGVGIDDGQLRVNRAWLFTPDGTLAATYDKQHLAPGEHGFAAGHDIVVQSIHGRVYGIAICKDMFFAALGGLYGERETAVMLVPAWNPGWEDARMEGWNTLVRGVENGYAVVRVAREGFMTVSDAYGRIVAETESKPLPGSALLARLQVPERVHTLYTRIGDPFGWLCVAASAVLLLLGRRRPG